MPIFSHQQKSRAVSNFKAMNRFCIGLVYTEIDLVYHFIEIYLFKYRIIIHVNIFGILYYSCFSLVICTLKYENKINHASSMMINCITRSLMDCTPERLIKNKVVRFATPGEGLKSARFKQMKSNI